METEATRSWARRSFEATKLSTAGTGLALVALGGAIFAVQELALGRLAGLEHEAGRLSSVRSTLTHIVIVAYLATALVYYEQVRDQSVAKLREILADAGREIPRRYRMIVSVAGVVGIGVALLMSVTISPGSVSYDPSSWTPESGWERILSLVIGFTSGRLWALIVVQSGRFSTLAETIPRIDLLEPERLEPFVRLGLTGALLVIGSVSVFALFLVGVGYLAIVASVMVPSLIVGGLALFLPLRGVRRRVRLAKREELRWCRERIRHARDALAAGRSSGTLEALLAWERRVASVSEWPVDSSTLSRFALYLLIPLGSWAGAAMVERAIDALLD